MRDSEDGQKPPIRHTVPKPSPSPRKTDANSRNRNTPLLRLSEIDRLVGAAIEERRHEIGMTRKVLSDALDVSLTQMEQFEKGHVRIRPEMLMNISHILKFRPSSFFMNLSGVSAENIIENANRLIDNILSWRDRRETDQGNGDSGEINRGEIYQIVYFSASLLPPLDSGGQREVENILEASRSRNHRCGVTGALTYNELNFAQVLEGNRADVEDIFRSIQRDQRHTKILVAQERWILKRDFAAWAMAHVGDHGSPRVISPNSKLQDVIARGNLASIELIEMMKFFLSGPSPPP